MWVTYSMNKEDMWVSRIPVPVKDKVTQNVNDDFSKMVAGKELNEWNIYSPLWCNVSVEQKALALRDSDPFDYAKAERVFPVAKKAEVTFKLSAAQTSHGQLEIELADRKGMACLRLILDSTGNILTKQGYRNKSLGKYKQGEELTIKIELNTATRFYNVIINGGKPAANIFSSRSSRWKDWYSAQEQFVVFRMQIHLPIRTMIFRVPTAGIRKQNT